MAKALDPTNGFIIHGWMVTDLKLRGPELMTYAIVHQFSQSKAGIFKGGVPYIQAWLGCGINSARKYLHSLEEMGLLQAIDGRHDGVPYRDYKVVENQIPQNLEYIPQKMEGDTPKFGRRIPQILEVDNNKDNKRENNTPPTPSQVAAYCRERGFADPEGFASYYIAYQTEAGWKRKDGKAITNWKLNVLTWERYHKQETFSTSAANRQRQMTPEEFDKYLYEE